ncbi:MAG TPA: hypothetical protein PKJ15_05465 [Methanomassiliicoccales archaeon]|nr:hypothetical protein [Methanomassiliicoccales archaeon]
MKKLGSWFVPYLMGLLIVFEGVALVVLAREIELVDVLVMDQMMTMILGAVLIVLGLLLFIPVFPQLQKLSERLMKRMQVAAAVAVLVISLIFLLIAAPAEVEGYGSIGKNWVVLAAAQLFLLAILAFVFMYYEPLANRRLAWLEWLGMFAACLVITEGIVIFGLRGELNVHGQLTSGPVLMIVIGVVLVALGILEMVIFNRRREGESEKALEMMDWAGLGVSIAIGAIGLFGLMITTSMTLDGAIYSYYWLLIAAMALALLAPLLNYTQTVVAGREGWNMDLGLITTILLLLAIPFAVAF